MIIWTNCIYIATPLNILTTITTTYIYYDNILLHNHHKCTCFQLRSFIGQFSRESRPHCFPNVKWILVSSFKIKETSIRSFRQDKENYGDHFITSSIAMIGFCVHSYVKVSKYCTLCSKVTGVVIFNSILNNLVEAIFSFLSWYYNNINNFI